MACEKQTREDSFRGRHHRPRNDLSGIHGPSHHVKYRLILLSFIPIFIHLQLFLMKERCTDSALAICCRRFSSRLSPPPLPLLSLPISHHVLPPSSYPQHAANLNTTQNIGFAVASYERVPSLAVIPVPAKKEKKKNTVAEVPHFPSHLSPPPAARPSSLHLFFPFLISFVTHLLISRSLPLQEERSCFLFTSLSRLSSPLSMIQR